MADKDLYQILGLQKGASDAEIKSAYRNLAKKYHPDLYAGKPENEKKAAEEKFKEINHAYTVLSDPEKKKVYDTYGSEDGPQFDPNAGGGFGGFSGGMNFDDIISNIFGGFGGFGGGSRSSSRNAPQSGSDIEVKLTITFEEAAFGCKKTIRIKRVENCPDCNGTGAKNGSSLKTCTSCNGAGYVNRIQRTPFGQIQTQGVCPNCKGKGKIVMEQCPKCHGQGRVEQLRDIEVQIPAGVDNGQHKIMRNEGHHGINGGGKGDLIVYLNVQPHKYFKRRNADIMIELPINPVEAALGTTINVPTLSGTTAVKIPEGTQSGEILTVKGKGIRKLNSDSYGDLYVKVIVETPKSLSREQKDLLNKLKVSFDSKQFPMKKKYDDVTK